MTTSAGTKVVPVEPTDEMVAAGLTVIHGNDNVWNAAAEIYQAMLAAAPSAPVQAGELVKQLRHAGAVWQDHKALAAVLYEAAAEIERLSAAAVEDGPVAVDSAIAACEAVCRQFAETAKGLADESRDDERARFRDKQYAHEMDAEAIRSLRKFPADMEAAAPDAGSAEPVAVIIDSQFADFGDNRIRAIKLSLGVNLYDDDELYARPPAPTTAWIDATTVERNSRPPAPKVSQDALREIAIKWSATLRSNTFDNILGAIREALELAGRK